MWFRVDDGFPGHRKVRALIRQGRQDAIGLWALCGAWSSAHLEEGFCPDEQVSLFAGSRQRADKLVEALGGVSLLRRAEKNGEPGIQLHDYTDYNPTVEQVEAERKASRERQRKAREAAKSQRESQKKSRRDSGVTNNVSHGPPDPTRPEDIPKTSSSGGEPPVGKQSVDVGAVVAAWVDGAQESTGERPASRLVSQVGRQAKELALEGRWDQARLVAAAHDAGAKGFADLPRELMRAAVGNGTGRPAGVRPSEEWMDA